MRISIKELNNKSRKGTYIYIRTKGKKGSYYKFKEHTPIDAYKQYYTDRVKNKLKGTLKQYQDTYTQKIQGTRIKRTRISQQADRYITKIKKQRPELLQAIKKGITYSNIKNVLTANNDTIRKAQEDLMKHLVLDKELLKLIITEENMQKLQNRFEYRIEIKSNKGTETKAAKLRGTPTTTIMRLQQQFKQGANYKYIGQALKLLNYTSIDGNKDEFKLTAISMQIIFRKAK